MTRATPTPTPTPNPTATATYTPAPTPTYIPAATCGLATVVSTVGGMMRVLVRRAAWALLGGALIGASPDAAAQEPPAGVTTAGQLELARLVDLAADRLKVPIEYDAGALKGVVTLRLPEGLSDEDLWELTNRALAARGLTTVQSPGSRGLSVVKLADAKGLAGLRDVGPGPAESPGVAPGYLSAVIRVQHRPAKDLVESLKLVLSKEGGAAAVLGESLILVSDLAPRVAQARELIGALDVDAPTEVDEVETVYLAPAQLVTLVQQVSAKRLAAGGEAVKGEVVASPNASSVLVIAPPDRLLYWKLLVARLDRREPVETVTYSTKYFGVKEVARLIEQSVKEGPAGAAADDRFRVVPDELTGSLIVTATPSQHERIQGLIARLDSVSVGSRRPVKTFVIKNRPAADVLLVLEQLLDAGVLEAGPGDPGLASALAPTAASAAGALQQTASSSAVQAQPVERAGSATAPEPAPGGGPRRFGGPGGAGGGLGGDGAGRVGGERPISLTVDQGTNSIIAIGEPRALAQLEALLSSIDVRQPQVLLEVMLVSLTEAQGLQLGVEIEKLTTLDGTVIRLASLFGLSSGAAGGVRAVGDAAGFTGTALNPGDFNLVVRALQNMNHGRSLSAPQVLVNNNQQAVLSSVLQQPFAETNASTTVATTSFGGTQDAGTTLSIRPQIAEGDHLVLQYSVALSSFVGSASSAALPPPRQQNTVQSTVTIPDGYTVVVGGLELQTDTKSVAQVPLLGDVPLVGELFKNRNNSSSRTRFFVFIRAGVLRSRSFEDLKYVSDVRASAMQVDDGFPDVEPMIIR